MIKKETQEAKIILVGADEDEKEKINNYISEHGLDKNSIEVKGWIRGEEMQDILKSVAVVCSPSIYPDPLLAGANYEAAFFKKPVVTTCFGGAKEFVIDGETGYVVNPFKKEELAEEIINILTNEGLAQKFGKAGYQRLKNEFSLDEYIEKLLGWYNKYIK